MITLKPWGTEESLANLGKRLSIKEGYKSSLMRYTSTDELLYVEDGLVKLEAGPDTDKLVTSWLQDGDRVVMESMTWHRFTGLRESVIFEFMQGEGSAEKHSEGGKLEEAEFRGLLSEFVSLQVKGPVIDLDSAKILSERFKALRRIIGMINGCFDLLHPGHVELFRQARSRCDVLFVAVNTDKSVKALKGNDRPFIPEEGRLAMVGSTRFVDYVVPIEDSTCLALVDAINPDVYVATTEHMGDGPEAREVKMKGGRVDIVKMLPGYHTTDMVRKIRSS